MLYGYQKDGKIYVTAATTFFEFDELFNRLDEKSVTYRRPDVMDILVDDTLSALTVQPVVVTYKTVKAKKEYPLDITYKSEMECIDLQKKMLKEHKKNQDIQTNSENYKRDYGIGLDANNPAKRHLPKETTETKTTLADLLGIKDFDPWDTRTEEQKEKAKEALDKAKKDGKLNDESFGGEPTGDARPEEKEEKDDGKTARIRDMKIVKDANGNIIGIENVLAEKGMWDDEEEKTDTPIDEDWFIAEADFVSTYFRVNAYDIDVEKAKSVVTDGGFKSSKIYRCKNVGNDCWMAFIKLVWADEVKDILIAAGIKAESMGVNNRGEKLLESTDAAIVDDQNRAELVRPWNNEDIPLTDKEIKKVKGKEFLYNIEKMKKGVRVYIVPLSWFDKNGTLYSHNLPIDHLLPKDTVQSSPGIFDNEFERPESMLRHLKEKAFLESLLFDMFVQETF